MVHVDELLQLLEMGPLASSEIQKRLSSSQPTRSRLIRRAGSQVARVGRGRATRYLALREVFEARIDQPVYGVDTHGVAAHLATLHASRDGSYLLRLPSSARVTAESTPRWLRGRDADDSFPGLSYLLEDLRPTGFLGRRIGRHVGVAWGIPRDPRRWSDAQLGRWLLEGGDELRYAADGPGAPAWGAPRQARRGSWGSPSHGRS